ncbi:hypothetical protein PEBR_30380 [Penicillium brasilianum]|uniref:Fibroin-3 related protein n=1 Tax=Penicillium brasilianum TaxID=104259 RepID=A0A1S9RG58_PENBI|nr:hypothetical protein PEBR_30380 [Penicillium brasilianum]
MSPTSMATLWARSVASDIESVPSTFSSWDKCMSKAYCKWPVIVGIIIGSVILIGIIGCIINCLCCGYQCCKCCCGCCCPSGRRRNKQPKQPKHYDEPISYNQPPPPPQFNPHTPYTPSPAPPVYRGAIQTATFDNPKSPGTKVDEDALPAMPTWAGAVDKHVEDPSHRDEVEMEPLNPQGHPDRTQGASPLHVATSPSNYPPDRTGSAPGYRGFTPTDPYARRSPGPAAALAAVQDPYGRRSPGMATPARAADPYARRSPGPQAMMDPYGRRSPGPAAAYGAAQDPYARRSPALASPVSAPSQYDQHSYNQQGYDYQHQQQPYDEYPNGTGAGGYHAVTSQSPLSYQPQTTTYNAMPASYSTSPEHAHNSPAGFQRQPSFGSSQYPPTYTSHPASPPPPFQSTAGSEYGAHEYAAGVGLAVGGEPGRERPPSLLQSGRRPAPGTYRAV